MKKLQKHKHLISAYIVSFFAIAFTLLPITWLFMLSIKSIMAKYKKLPSIIFDEIDTGVSGEISKKMGTIMKELGSRIQTFSITHLPQIAAMGESHFLIYKNDIDGYTKTMISRLNDSERIVEIAKMLEGNNASESAYTHAKQLLN